MTSEFTEKTCLIVGASGAIGIAVAEQFYLHGARIALTSHSLRKAPFSKNLRPRDLRIARFTLDVCDRKEIQALVSKVRRKFGPIDILVNCSGVLGPVGPTHTVSVKRWVNTVEVNFIGSFYLAQAVLPSMLQRGAGKIIYFSGGGAAYGRPLFTAYGASKAALVRFTESLAQELRDKNIQVNAIAPGPVRSRMWDELRASGSAGGPQAIEELKRMDATGGVSAECAARLAVFLASCRSDGLTGRLVSAIHDKWEGMEARIPKLMSTDAWTLRRVPLGE